MLEIEMCCPPSHLKCPLLLALCLPRSLLLKLLKLFKTAWQSSVAAKLLTVVFSRAVRREFGAWLCIGEGSPPCGYMLILNNESRVIEDNTLTCRKWLAGWGDGIRRSSFHAGYRWQ